MDLVSRSVGEGLIVTALIEGILAAGIFDWGAKACVDLYHNGTILDLQASPAQLFHNNSLL